ncbi:uncharacterized protein LOC119368478 [Triticum dicoccoides]|uniref:uncharacterized protein LOC119368478 n=1 Tax=Triticum dicoccoides TaxID=85692 RepID=UPI00188E7F74|nr:uncharacterized protein LOC119368478 [Triticum dicoccoides]
MAATKAAVIKLSVLLLAMSQLVHMATPTADPMTTASSSLLVTSVSGPSEGEVHPKPSHIREEKVLLDAPKPSIPVPPPPPHLVLPCMGRACVDLTAGDDQSQVQLELQVTKTKRNKSP